MISNDIRDTVLEPTLPIDRLLTAAQDEKVVQSMERLYQDLDRDIASQPGHCWIKSACCHFGTSGHRLFVTALEVCYYLSRQSPAPVCGESCPHIVDSLCSVRSVRPLGCRIYFCDPTAQGWQGPMTEAYLARLRQLHVECGVPYFYADWLQVLAAIRAHLGGTD